MRRRIALGLVASLAALAALSTLPAGATVSGPNGKIVFGQDFPLTSFTIDPDGSDPHQIGPVETICTTWSPDSTKVLCNLLSEEGVPQPATANPDGSGLTVLNPNLPLGLACLNWSPDGSRLLCTTGEEANPAEQGLYTVRSSDAGDLVRVTTTPAVGHGYSPDGSRILFTRFDSNDHGTLISVKPDGSDLVELSPPGLSVIDLGFFDGVGADWAPDGSRVAFAAFDESSRRTTGLFVVNADGSGLRLVTPSGVGALSAQWSPNGALIAFGSCCGISHAWVVHPNGTGLRRVTPGRFLTPVWSPDSTKLLLNSRDRNDQTSLWTVNTDGSGLSKLTDTTGLAHYAWGSAPAE
jgi:TolB protein